MRTDHESPIPRLLPSLRVYDISGRYRPSLYFAHLPFPCASYNLNLYPRYSNHTLANPKRIESRNLPVEARICLFKRLNPRLVTSRFC